MKSFSIFLVLGTFLAGSATFAAVSDEDFAKLRADFEMLAERFEQLAAENAELRAANSQTANAVIEVQEEVAQQGENWADRIGIKGDFRYRYQNDEFGSNLAAALGNDDSRNRQRIRARAAIVAKLQPDLEVGLGIATGGDDPVSTNQTLGGGGSTKDVRLDLAYVDWTGLENTHVRGGKFKNTLKVASKSQLQWDGDWRPEGIDVAWDNETVFAQGLGTWLESDSNSANTEFAYIVQGGGRVNVGPVRLTGGIGYTDISAAGEPCFFEEDDFNFCGGNQVDGAGNYLYDFEVYNVFAEAALELLGMPFSVFADFIKNDAADEFDSGYLVGAKLGSAKNAGSWDLMYYYEEIESNATLGLLTNSDFGGGGTNGEGSAFAGTYAFTDQTSFKLSYYLVDRNTDGIAGILGGEEFDSDTLQVDFSFKYK